MVSRTPDSGDGALALFLSVRKYGTTGPVIVNVVMSR